MPSAGYQRGTDGVRVPFPHVQRAAQTIHNAVRHIYPSPTPSVQGAAQPTLLRQRQEQGPGYVPFINPKWPTGLRGRGRPFWFPVGLFRKDS